MARKAALRLAAKYNCVLNVIIGLHIEHALEKEIAQLVASFEECLSLIEKRLKSKLIDS